MCGKFSSVFQSYSELASKLLDRLQIEVSKQDRVKVDQAVEFALQSSDYLARSQSRRARDVFFRREFLKAIRSLLNGQVSDAMCSASPELRKFVSTWIMREATPPRDLNDSSRSILGWLDPGSWSAPEVGAGMGDQFVSEVILASAAEVLILQEDAIQQ
jgi:hypothetical protein